jgi:hypothetical protein
MTKSCPKTRKPMAPMRSHYALCKCGFITSQTEKPSTIQPQDQNDRPTVKTRHASESCSTANHTYPKNHCVQIGNSSRNSQADLETQAWSYEKELSMDSTFSDRPSETVTTRYCNRTPTVPREILTATAQSNFPGDEGCFFVGNQRNSIWAASGVLSRTRVKRDIGAQRAMLSICFSRPGIHEGAYDHRKGVLTVIS